MKKTEQNLLIKEVLKMIGARWSTEEQESVKKDLNDLNKTTELIGELIENDAKTIPFNGRRPSVFKKVEMRFELYRETIARLESINWEHERTLELIARKLGAPK